MSIWANQLKQIGNDVIHGNIRELSLVLAGANPGAYVDFVMAHGADEEDTLYASWDENALILYHSGSKTDDKPETDKKEDKTVEGNNENKTNSEKTVKDVIDSMNEEQKTVLYAMVGQAIEDSKSGKNIEEDDEDMKHNVFDNEIEEKDNVLSHADMEVIIGDAKRYGSVKESFLAHADE